MESFYSLSIVCLMNKQTTKKMRGGDVLMIFKDLSFFNSVCLIEENIYWLNLQGFVLLKLLLLDIFNSLKLCLWISKLTYDHEVIDSYWGYTLIFILIFKWHFSLKKIYMWEVLNFVTAIFLCYFNKYLIFNIFW